MEGLVLIIKIAGAGAGKTTSMAQKIVEKRNELAPDKIIYCITYTNTAADRISSVLKERFGVIPQNIKVSTIHSFLYSELISPYYFLLFGKQYVATSNIVLNKNPVYSAYKIAELEKKSILHVSVFSERAKWVISKKTKDSQARKTKRGIILKKFKKYCGEIFIDESQDMDKDMVEIVTVLNELSIPLELVGDPKQDLRGFGSLRKISSTFPDNIHYINNCHRCPEKHLSLSNLLVSNSEKQISGKMGGRLEIYFESETNIQSFVNTKKFDLMYIAAKNDRYETSKERQNNIQIKNLFFEVHELLLNYDETKKQSEISIKRDAYFYTIELLKRYHETDNLYASLNFLTDQFSDMGKQTFAKIRDALKIDSVDEKNKLIVSSIDSIKGQEGENCLFILTTDLAPYFFGDKTTDNKTKNRLYVALTRSLNKLTILISKEVEDQYPKNIIVDYLVENNLTSLFDNISLI